MAFRNEKGMTIVVTGTTVTLKRARELLDKKCGKLIIMEYSKYGTPVPVEVNEDPVYDESSETGEQTQSSLVEYAIPAFHGPTPNARTSELRLITLSILWVLVCFIFYVSTPMLRQQLGLPVDGSRRAIGIVDLSLPARLDSTPEFSGIHDCNDVPAAETCSP